MTGLVPIFIGAIISACAAIGAVIVTYILTKRREHEADWRKFKFFQYQEFVLALPGIVNRSPPPLKPAIPMP